MPAARLIKIRSASAGSSRRSARAVQRCHARFRLSTPASMIISGPGALGLNWRRDDNTLALCQRLARPEERRFLFRHHDSPTRSSRLIVPKNSPPTKSASNGTSPRRTCAPKWLRSITTTTTCRLSSASIWVQSRCRAWQRAAGRMSRASTPRIDWDIDPRADAASRARPPMDRTRQFRHHRRSSCNRQRFAERARHQL